MDLPAEILSRIFDLAADEDIVFYYGLPTSFADSAWVKEYNTWRLRSPQDALNLIQHQSYRTKKNIMRTCKKFYSVNLESLYKCLFLTRPERLPLLANILEASAASARETNSAPLGWWTRRFHLTQLYAPRDNRYTLPELEDALVRIARQCPNLEIFILPWPLRIHFGPLAEALVGRGALQFNPATPEVENVPTLVVTPSLLPTPTIPENFTHIRTIHWSLPSTSLPKLIWALDSLPYLLAAHLELVSPSHSNSEEEHEDDDDVGPQLQPQHKYENDHDYEQYADTPLGSAAGIAPSLSFPHLRQLQLRGYISQLVELAAGGWSLPSLETCIFDEGWSSGDVPDITAFLARHGASLRTLEVRYTTQGAGHASTTTIAAGGAGAMDVRAMLDMCPLLETFAFNADWRILPQEHDTNRRASELVNRPHTCLRTIGLYGLRYAFGVNSSIGAGPAKAGNSSGSTRRQTSEQDSLTAYITTRSNDYNVAALSKRNFPRLERVRVLSARVLLDLNEADGPAGASSRDANGVSGAVAPGPFEGWQEGGMERWERWWDGFAAMGVRLEDCTGALLGTLPDDDDEEEDEDEGSSDDDAEVYEDEEDVEEGPLWEIDLPLEPAPDDGPLGERTVELRQLLEECRLMEQSREESMFAPLMGMGLGMPGVTLSSRGTSRVSSINLGAGPSGVRR